MPNKTKLFTLLLGLSLLYLLPIIISDRPYIDDLGRSVLGYTWWGLNGRPLADIVMISLSMGSPILDLSPLPLLIGISVLCFTLTAYISKLIPNRPAAEKLLVSFCVIANPFLLECLSYKFDSLTMLLSISVLFVPYTLAIRSSLNWIASITCVIACLSLYQASIGIFVILAFIECVFSANGTNGVIKSAISRAIQLSLGYVAYSNIVLQAFSGGDYVKNHSEFISLSSPDDLIKNLMGVKELSQAYLSSLPTLIIFAYTALVIIGMACVVSSLAKKKLVIGSIIALVMPFAAILFSMFHIILLKNAVLSPRVLISSSALFLLYAMIISKGFSRLNRAYLLLLPFVICSFSLAYAYGNSLKHQKTMDEQLSASLAYDIYSLNKKFTSISFIGTSPSAPQRDLAIKRMPLIKYLTPIYMRGDWVWGAKLLAYNGLNLTLNPIKGNIEACNVVKRNSRYSIIESGDGVIVSFDPNICK